MTNREYIESILDSLSDEERVTLVITVCENYGVKIVGNKLIVDHSKPASVDSTFQKTWNEYWDELKRIRDE